MKGTCCFLSPHSRVTQALRYGWTLDDTCLVCACVLESSSSSVLAALGKLGPLRAMVCLVSNEHGHEHGHGHGHGPFAADIDHPSLIGRDVD